MQPMVVEFQADQLGSDVISTEVSRKIANILQSDVKVIMFFIKLEF
jgi:hypothetical protein